MKSFGVLYTVARDELCVKKVGGTILYRAIKVLGREGR